MMHVEPHKFPPHPAQNRRRFKAQEDVEYRQKKRRLFTDPLPDGRLDPDGCAGRYLERQKLLECRVRRAWPQVIHIWEPLPTKAPGPHLTAPYCCYVRTVIFYVRPYIQLSRRRGFAEWGQVETMIHWDDRLSFDGLFWEAGGGSVVWKDGRWWLRRDAWKNSRRAREWNGLEP